MLSHQDWLAVSKRGLIRHHQHIHSRKMIWWSLPDHVWDQ